MPRTPSLGLMVQVLRLLSLPKRHAFLCSSASFILILACNILAEGNMSAQKGHWPSFLLFASETLGRFILFSCRADDGIGGMRLSVRPYIMDLVATNGTFLNGERIDDMVWIHLFIFAASCAWLRLCSPAIFAVKTCFVFFTIELMAVAS